MPRVSSLAAVIAVTALIQSPSAALAQGASESPAGWVQHFSTGWDESAWSQRSRRNPDGYMREDDDRGWEARMVALQELVRLGDTSLPVLHELLTSGDAPHRIFAAQVLGYITSNSSKAPLLEAARDDDDPVVRLYAVDSLGMLGEAAADVDWDGLMQNESVNDVKKHISYAIERAGTPVDPAIIETLLEWDPATMNSVALGREAPDFELQSAQGETIRLSDYRGEKAVVLVFVYGDT